MRFLSAGALRAASMAKRGAAGVISPPPSAARSYHARASTPIGEQIVSTMLDNWVLCLGIFGTGAANFTYWMDFGGRWAREEEERKLNRAASAEWDKLKAEEIKERLGVGAAVARESKVVRSNDPIERRLRAKLESDKKKVVKNAEEPGGPTLNGSSQEDSDDEELGSKTKAFVKKRPADWTLSLQQGKKKLK